MHLAGPWAEPAGPVAEPAGDLLRRVARGDEAAFRSLYELLAPRVCGLARRVVRDPAQAEEVAQEALVEVWRTAPRYDAAKGSATAWVLTITHRRAVDRVRAAQSGADRERRFAAASVETPYDDVVEGVTASLEQQQGPALPAGPHRPATGGDHARLLPRLQLPRGGGEAGRRAADHQIPATRRAHPPARLSRRRSRPRHRTGQVTAMNEQMIKQSVRAASGPPEALRGRA